MSETGLSTLAERIRQGDPETMRDLLAGTLPAVERAIAAHYTPTSRADPADAVQSALNSLFARLGRREATLEALPDLDALGGWLVRTASRKSLRYLREAATEGRHQEAVARFAQAARWADLPESVLEGLVRRCGEDVASELLALVPAEDRPLFAAIYRGYQQGKTPTQIDEELAREQGTVPRTVQRKRLALFALLADGRG